MTITELTQVFFPMLLRGMAVTLRIAVIGVVLGFLIGAVFGCLKTANHKILRGIAGIYTNIFRSLPLLVQAMYFYYVLPKIIGVDIDSEVMGMLILGLNSGAFFTEIIRGAFEKVDGGIREAGLALGLSETRVFFRLIVPMAFRSIIPSLCNQFIISIKDTSILTIIAINEMVQMTKNYVAMSFHTIEAYTVLALSYLILLSLLTILQKILEKKLLIPGTGKAQTA